MLFPGETVCMVDFMLWPWFERLPVLNRVVQETAINHRNYPRLASWIEHMVSLPAVKETMFDADSHAHFLKTLRVDKNPNFDYGLSSRPKL